MNDGLKLRAERINDLAAKATPGPWEQFNGYVVRKCVDDTCAPIASIDAPYRKFVGIVRGEHEAQANLRLIAAAHDMAQLVVDQQSEIERLRKDAERYRWMRGEATRYKGNDAAGLLTVSVTRLQRRAAGDGFTGFAITPRRADFDSEIDAAMSGARGAGYAPRQPMPDEPRCVPDTPLTEVRVRQIVREELASNVRVRP